MRGVASFTYQFRRWLPEACLENPTDACSIVCDAKEDVLASYQKTAWDLHFQEYSSLNSRCVWGTCTIAA